MPFLSSVFLLKSILLDSQLPELEVFPSWILVMLKIYLTKSGKKCFCLNMPTTTRLYNTAPRNVFKPGRDLRFPDVLYNGLRVKDCVLSVMVNGKSGKNLITFA